MDKDNEKEDEKVGYKRPPRKTQWKKGQSGNPSGKRKQPALSAQPIDYYLASELMQIVETRENNGEKCSMPLSQALATNFLRKLPQAPAKVQLEAIKTFAKLDLQGYQQAIIYKMSTQEDSVYSEEERRLMALLRKDPDTTK